MSLPLRQSDKLRNELVSAASGIRFEDSKTSEENEQSFPRVVFSACEDDLMLDTGTTESAAEPIISHTGQRGFLGSLACSLLLHTGLLLVCGMVVTVVRNSTELVLTDPIRATLGEEEILDLNPQGADGADLAVELPPPLTSSAAVTRISNSFTPEERQQKFSASQFEPTIAVEVEAKTEEEHKVVIRPGNGKKFRFQRPGGGQAVTKGSFTVWTEPADPLPRQPYFIVFQIRVPRDLETFPKSDLRIDVRGTDSFHLQIPDPKRNYSFVGDLDVVDGQVQLVIPIPGAPALVRDLIQVESRKILRERQRLAITF